MRKIVTGCIIILAFHLLISCQSKGTYHFSQPLEQIDTIEIIERNYAGTIVKVLNVLDKEEYAQILEDIKELPCYLWWNDPPNGIEGKAIKITYLNKEIDYLTERSVAVYSNNRYKYGPIILTRKILKNCLLSIWSHSHYIVDSWL